MSRNKSKKLKRRKEQRDMWQEQKDKSLDAWKQRTLTATPLTEEVNINDRDEQD